MELSEDVTWAIDLNSGGAALLIALLVNRGQRLLYIPGRTVHHASGSYRGDGKTDAKDAYVIADQARMRRDLHPMQTGDEIGRPAHPHRPPLRPGRGPHPGDQPAGELVADLGHRRSVSVPVGLSAALQHVVTGVQDHPRRGVRVLVAEVQPQPPLLGGGPWTSRVRGIFRPSSQARETEGQPDGCPRSVRAARSASPGSDVVGIVGAAVIRGGRAGPDAVASAVGRVCWDEGGRRCTAVCPPVGGLARAAPVSHPGGGPADRCRDLQRHLRLPGVALQRWVVTPTQLAQPMGCSAQ